MATIRRLDRVDVLAGDVSQAARTYERNFGFTVAKRDETGAVTIVVGDAAIRILPAGAPASAASAAPAEGMAAVWLEADDVEEVARKLRAAGITPGPVKVEEGRRVLALELSLSAGAPVFIFDRKNPETR